MNCSPVLCCLSVTSPTREQSHAHCGIAMEMKAASVSIAMVNKLKSGTRIPDGWKLLRSSDQCVCKFSVCHCALML